MTTIDKPVRVKFSIGIGIANAEQTETIEITSEELAGSTLEEYCDQYLQDMLSNYLDMFWDIEE